MTMVIMLLLLHRGDTALLNCWKDFELFSPSRKYLREGEILHVYKGSKTQMVQYYMFNDLLVRGAMHYCLAGYWISACRSTSTSDTSTTENVV